MPKSLLAAGIKTEILAEERHHVVLESVGYRTGVSSVIDLKAMRDSISVQNLVELCRIVFQAILVAHVDGYSPVLPETTDVLIDKRERRISSDKVKPMSMTMRIGPLTRAPRLFSGPACGAFSASLRR